jgi:ferric iron reductase protein FhuF
MAPAGVRLRLDSVTPMVEAAEVLAAVRRAAAVNPLFALGTGPTPHGEEGWRLASDLADVDVAAQLVGDVGQAFGGPAARISASMAVLGYSARLVAPTVATLLRDGLLLDAAATRVCWRYAPGHGFQLRLPEPSGSRDAPLPRRWCQAVIDDHLAPLIRSVRAVVPVAKGLLWGNVASSLAGALRSLALAGAVPLPACHDAGLTLLDHGPLRGSGTLTVQSGQLSFVRRSCCLYYRLPGGGLCGDCSLREDGGHG